MLRKKAGAHHQRPSPDPMRMNNTEVQTDLPIRQVCALIGSDRASSLTGMEVFIFNGAVGLHAVAREKFGKNLPEQNAPWSPAGQFDLTPPHP